MRFTVFALLALATLAVSIGNLFAQSVDHSSRVRTVIASIDASFGEDITAIQAATVGQRIALLQQMTAHSTEVRTAENALDRLELGVLLVSVGKYESARDYLQDIEASLVALPNMDALILRTSVAKFLAFTAGDEESEAYESLVSISTDQSLFAQLPPVLQWRYYIHRLRSKDPRLSGIESEELLDNLVSGAIEVFASLSSRTEIMDVRVVRNAALMFDYSRLRPKLLRLMQIAALHPEGDLATLLRADICAGLLGARAPEATATERALDTTRCDQLTKPNQVRQSHVRLFGADPTVAGSTIFKSEVQLVAPAYMLSRGVAAEELDQAAGYYRQGLALLGWRADQTQGIELALLLHLAEVLVIQQKGTEAKFYLRRIIAEPLWEVGKLRALYLLSDVLGAEDNQVELEHVQEELDLELHKMNPRPRDEIAELKVVRTWTSIRQNNLAAAEIRAAEARKAIGELVVGQDSFKTLSAALSALELTIAILDRRPDAYGKGEALLNDNQQVSGWWRQFLRIALIVRSREAQTYQAVLQGIVGEDPAATDWMIAAKSAQWAIDLLYRDGELVVAKAVERWLAGYVDKPPLQDTAFGHRTRIRIAEHLKDAADYTEAIRILSRVLESKKLSPELETEARLLVASSLKSLGETERAGGAVRSAEVALQSVESLSPALRDAVRAMNPEGVVDRAEPDMDSITTVVAEAADDVVMVDREKPLPDDVRALIGSYENDNNYNPWPRLRDLARRLEKAKRYSDAIVVLDHLVAKLDRDKDVELRLFLLLRIGELHTNPSVVEKGAGKERLIEVVERTEGNRSQTDLRLSALINLIQLEGSDGDRESIAVYYSLYLSTPEWRWGLDESDAIQRIQEALEVAANIQSASLFELGSSELFKLAYAVGTESTLSALSQYESTQAQFNTPFLEVKSAIARLYLVTRVKTPDDEHYRDVLRSLANIYERAGLASESQMVASLRATLDAKIATGRGSANDRETVTYLIRGLGAIDRAMRGPLKQFHACQSLDDRYLQEIEKRERILTQGEFRRIIDALIGISDSYATIGRPSEADMCLAWAHKSLMRQVGRLPAAQLLALDHRLVVWFAKRYEFSKAKTMWQECTNTLFTHPASEKSSNAIVRAVNGHIASLIEGLREPSGYEFHLEIIDITSDALKKLAPTKAWSSMIARHKVGALLAMGWTGAAVSELDTLLKAVEETPRPIDSEEGDENLKAALAASRALRAHAFLTALKGEVVDRDVESALHALAAGESVRSWQVAALSNFSLTGQKACVGDAVGAEKHFSAGRALLGRHLPEDRKPWIALDVAMLEATLLDMAGKPREAATVLRLASERARQLATEANVSEGEDSLLRSWLNRALARQAHLLIAAGDVDAAKPVMSGFLDEIVSAGNQKLPYLVSIAEAYTRRPEGRSEAERLVDRVLSERSLMRQSASPALMRALTLKAEMLLRRGSENSAFQLLRERLEMATAFPTQLFGYAKQERLTNRLFEYQFGEGGGVPVGSASERLASNGDGVKAATLMLIALAKLKESRGAQAIPNEADLILELVQRLSLSQTGQALYLSSMRAAAGEMSLATAIRDYLLLETEIEDAAMEEQRQSVTGSSWYLAGALGEPYSMIPPCVSEAPLILDTTRSALGYRSGELRDRSSRANRDYRRVVDLLRANWPKALDQLDPQPVNLTNALKSLDLDEAFVQLISHGNKVLVVSLSHHSGVMVDEVDLQYNDEPISETIRRIRLTLDPATAGRTPYDVDRAAHLGTKLVNALRDQRGKVSRLYVVADGALQSLPLHVLLTELPKNEDRQAYHSLRWFDKDFSVVMLPSLANLPLSKRVRQAPQITIEKRFFGIGGPALVGTREGGCLDAMNSSILDDRKRIDPRKLRNYCEIGRTVGVVSRIARAFGTNLERSAYVGRDATEARLKTLSREGKLKGLEVLVIATHGLLAEETLGAAGIAEPALVLSPPEVATAADDGLLTAREVMALDMDVSWTFLTACNTAGSDGRPGAEPLSGLARAFMAGGSLGLVVSHWPVDANAVADLSSHAIENWKLRGMPMDKALVDAMVKVRTGKDGYRALLHHPAYWAPFVVVGGVM